ncbi:MAG: hypothetical protein ABEL04_06900 [Salinibacter sp.]|uniref:hypothetical protein n=1 Tax=Salinibacter sp. TaxID=2065818 RepID=UPI0035D4C941
MPEFGPFIVALGFFAMIAYIAKVIGDTRIRRKALEAHLSADEADRFLNQGWNEPSTRSALKWGLVVLALGAGLLFVDLLAISFESPLAYAVLLVATGIALLGYYLIEQDDERVDGGPYAPSDAPTAESIGETEL